MEFVWVVSELVAFLTKLNSVDIFCHYRVILSIVHLFYLLFHRFFDLLSTFLSRGINKTKFQFFFCFLHLLLLSQRSDLFASDFTTSSLLARGIHSTSSAASETTPSSTAVLSISLLAALFKSKEVFFILGNVTEQYITIAEIYLSLFCEVAVKAGKRVFVHCHYSIQSTLSDLQWR